MSPRFPRRFGNYVLLKPLAKGGMGEIYVAAGGQMGGFEKLCVIKKVIREKADSAKAKRFLDEAKVVLRLSHSCLVTTFDAGEVDGEFYIAMELVEGKDLREVWNRCVRTRERIPLDVALHVVREVARALSYVHHYGDLKLVHRDVAPPNILLGYVGDIKLTDFGLARSVLKQEHTAPGVVYGRAAYLAPEQARGEIADARTDVYTLGVVLWELLTGQQFLQISGLDPATALAIVRHPKIVRPSSKAPWIAPELDAVVMKALAPERDDRFRSADEMRRALNEVIATIAPRAGADRIAEFLENLYRDVIEEERKERDAFLREVGRLRERTASASPRPPEPRAPVPEELRTPPSEPRVKIAARPVGAPRARPSSQPPPPPPPGAGPRLPGLPPAAAAARAAVRPSPAPAAASPPGGLARPPSPAPPAVPAPAAPPRKYQNQAPPAPAAAFSDSEALAQRFIGRVLGDRYRVVDTIGEGGMGQVFGAVHTEIGKRVAVKVLNPACSGRADLVERFRLEARAASKIGHPNIVDVTDFGTTEEGLVYYVMEQLQGVDLAEVLAQERKVDVVRAVQITIQVCQALHAAHQADIIHRDLKPENIFLQPRGAQGDAVKIIDFGLARSLQESAYGKSGRPLTNPGTPIGTPEYMAPEQADGKPVDARADIYAVGAILYEMITGQAPFSGHGYAEVLVRKSTDRPRRPSELAPGISRELDELILSTLERDPARRPQSMAQLEYELTKVLRGRGKAVAALLGIEPAEHDTPAPGPTAISDLQVQRKEVALRAIAELRAGAPPTPDGMPAERTPVVEASDLTVPAATVFPEEFPSPPVALGKVAARGGPAAPADASSALDRTVVDPPGIRPAGGQLSAATLFASGEARETGPPGAGGIAPGMVPPAHGLLARYAKPADETGPRARLLWIGVAVALAAGALWLALRR